MNVCRDKRTALGLSQEKFGQMLNVTRRTIIRWEQRPSDIPIRAMVALVKLDTEEAL